MVQPVALLTYGQKIPVIVRIKAAPPHDVMQADGLVESLDELRVPAHGAAFSHEGIGFKLAADTV
jgi:hypothetical protein